jgi:hypothetical protein
MKFYYNIVVNKNLCPAQLYAEIIRLKPDGERGFNFYLEAQPENVAEAEMIKHIADICKRGQLDRIRGAYRFSAARIYEPADLAAAELLRLSGGRGLLHGVIRSESGQLIMPAFRAKASLKIAGVFPNPWIIISNAVRNILEAAGLVGLIFVEVVIQGRSIHAANAPFWELSSSITLPKIVNAVRYENRSFPCYGIDDDSYQHPEIHYRCSDLRKLGFFDIAHTLEPLGDRDPSLIISQRFYQVCLSHKISLDVWPVRIDPNKNPQ